jgi:hypothetical protein
MEAVKSLVAKAIAPKFDMDLDMIYGTDGTPGRLQAIEHRCAVSACVCARERERPDTQALTNFLA